MIVDELIAVLGYETKGEDELKRFRQSIEDIAKRIAGFSDLTAKTATGVLNFGKSVISASAEFDKYQTALEATEGSAQKARKALDWVSAFAQKTPYEVGEVADAFARLRSYGIDPASGSLEAIGDATSATGKTLMQGVEAIGDATAGHFERLKDFGISTQAAGDAVTFTWMKNGETLSRTVQKNSADIAGFLQGFLGDRFSGAMARQSQTWGVMVSNLGEAWTGFLVKVGDAGFFDIAEKQLGRLLDYIGQLAENGTLDRWASGISSALTTISGFVGTAADSLIKDIQQITDMLDRNAGSWEIVAAIALGLAIGLFPVQALLVAVGLAIDDFLKYLRGGESVIGDFVGWLGQMRDALTEWVASLPDRIVTGIKSAFQAAFDAARGVIDDFIARATKKLSDFNPLNWLREPEAARSVIIPQGTGGGLSGPVNSTEGFTPDALDWTFQMQNAEGNLARINGSAPGNAVINDSRQDIRNLSTTVNVGGVTVNGVENAGPAVGAAVGNAVGQAAAGAPQITRGEMEPVL